MRTVSRLLSVALLAAALGACSHEGPSLDQPDRDGAVAAAAPRARPATSETADGVVRSYDATTGIAIVTDWAGEDHKVHGAGLADASYVTLADGGLQVPDPDSADPDATSTPAGSSMGRGVVTWFNTQRGYGFIADHEGRDIFVHHFDLIMVPSRTLTAGQRVWFDVKQGAKGLQAVEVRLAD